MKRVTLRIRGRVQGVGYRYNALDQAERLGLVGWVRNTADGQVELVAEGDEALLRKLIAWCHIGPRGARVSEVSEVWDSATGELRSFEIRR